MIDGWGICCEITLIWMSLDFTDDQSTLVQVMAWCRQATSHYLSQCWPRSLVSLGHNELTMFGVTLHGVTASSVRRIPEHAPRNTIVSFFDFVAWLAELIKVAQAMAVDVLFAKQLIGLLMSLSKRTVKPWQMITLLAPPVAQCVNADASIPTSQCHSQEQCYMWRNNIPVLENEFQDRNV